MLFSPHGSAPIRFELSQTNVATEGVTVTANATPNTMGSWTQIIASTAFDANGFWVALNSNASSSVSSNMLVNIGIGASSAELVLAPTLMAGGASIWVDGSGSSYFFPVPIPAGSRISAQCQSATGSRTVVVAFGLVGGVKIPGRWTGSRITAYGVDTATSSGTAHTPGTSPTYGTAAQISSSTANPIKYMQMGVDFAGDLTGANRRYLGRIGVGSSTQWLIEGLPFSETSSETVYYNHANWILSQCGIVIPAGADLRFASLATTVETRNVAIYGVD